MSYRCAFLGCGPRAEGHAKAYDLITTGVKVACCDLNTERLDTFAEKYHIPHRYTDLDEMLDKEKPDVVHLVTPPKLRVELMTRLAEAAVPGVIVEKPICIAADDYKALHQLEQCSATKFAVNHQLRHHPAVLDFLQRVEEGEIGEVRFLDASAMLPLAGQGVHVLDLLFAFNDYAEPETVFGAASGYDDIDGTHPSPRTMEALLTFRNGVRGALQAGEGAPVFESDDRVWMHKRIAVYGTHGFLHWRMNAWERSLPDGTVAHGEKDYAEEDVRGQANLPNAMFDWLEDDSAVSPTNLTTALDEWLVALAVYQSTVEAQPVGLPFAPPADLLERFKHFVGVQ